MSIFSRRADGGGEEAEYEKTSQITLEQLQKSAVTASIRSHCQ